MHSIAKHDYMDDGNVDTLSFLLIRESTSLSARIDSVLIGVDKPNTNKKSK